MRSKKSREILNCFKSYVARVSALFPQGICYFRCDNGTKYVNEDRKAFIAEKGIEFELTIPGTPELNGVGERLNRTLLQIVRCLVAVCPKGI